MRFESVVHGTELSHGFQRPGVSNGRTGTQSATGDRGARASKPAVDDTLDGARVVRFDLDGPADAKLFGTEGARRVSIWVDPALKLPVKAEVMDAAGRMLERHRFADLKINVGLTDQTFTLE